MNRHGPHTAHATRRDSNDALPVRANDDSTALQSPASPLPAFAGIVRPQRALPGQRLPGYNQRSWAVAAD